jgi:hypothetical protein
MQVTLEEVSMIAHLAGHPLPDLRAEPDSPPPEEASDPQLLFDRRAEDDPLVAAGRAYTAQSWPVLRTLSGILEKRRDARGLAAAERLEEIAGTVASKIFRSVSSASQPEHDPRDTQNDAHGSAKVALLLIEESRQAWRVLMRPGAAAANGTPAKFIEMLDALEATLLQRFPRAFEFVRPGFDTGELGGQGGEIARAMLTLTKPEIG